jgi:hypothetical protein
MFTAESIQARVRQQPFVPFRVVTSSGETHDVVHPELIMVGRRFLEIGVPAKPGVTIFDQVYRVALMHVTAINDLPVPASGGGNGPA